MLTTAEYNEVMQGKAILQGEIDRAEKDRQEYDQLKDGAANRHDMFEARMSFYTNYLSAAIEEYEAAHPLEE